MIIQGELAKVPGPYGEFSNKERRILSKIQVYGYRIGI